jgi:hypothetical protein
MPAKRCGRRWLHKVGTLLKTSAHSAFTILWAGCTLCIPAKNRDRMMSIWCIRMVQPLSSLSTCVRSRAHLNVYLIFITLEVSRILKRNLAEMWNNYKQMNRAKKYIFLKINLYLFRKQKYIVIYIGHIRI